MEKHENSWGLESGGGLCARQNNLLELELIGNAIDCFFGFLFEPSYGKETLFFSELSGSWHSSASA